MCQDMTWIDALGYAGALMSCLMVAPQTIKTLRQRHDPAALEGISVAAMCFILANATIWAVWAVLSGAYPAGVASLVNGPAAVLVLAAIIRSRRTSAPLPAHETSTPAVATGCECGWPDGSGHRLFVTAPPGYGTLLPCIGERHPHAVPVPAPAPAVVTVG